MNYVFRDFKTDNKQEFEKYFEQKNNEGYLWVTQEMEQSELKDDCEMVCLDFAEPREKRIEELEQQIEKMKRHCNCKHRDSEGYCEVKRTYLMDLSYDGCDKWELED